MADRQYGVVGLLTAVGFVLRAHCCDQHMLAACAQRIVCYLIGVHAVPDVAVHLAECVGSVVAAGNRRGARVYRVVLVESATNIAHQVDCIQYISCHVARPCLEGHLAEARR